MARKPLITNQKYVAPLAFGLAAILVVTTATDADAQRRRRGGGDPPAVTVVDVEVKRINERIAAVGTSRARKQVTLTTRVAGVIEEILFEGGTKVEPGQALIKLDSEPEAIAVETAEAQRAQAADTVDRYSRLSTGTITQVAEAEAKTALKVADAALRKARDDLSRMTIRAPFSGIMGLTNLEVGDYLAVGSPIASIDDRSSLLLEFTVPEDVATHMKVGLPVRANHISRSGEIYQGKIQAVGSRIDSVSRTLMVRAEIPNPDLKLIQRQLNDKGNLQQLGVVDSFNRRLHADLQSLDVGSCPLAQPKGREDKRNWQLRCTLNVTGHLRKL